MSPRDEPRRDPVDETSDESFPASDPPGWTTLTGAHADPPPTNVGGSDAVVIVHNAAAHKFEAHAAAGVAVLEYHVRKDGTLALLHTGVPHGLEGHGVGGRLARAALEYARDNKLLVDVRCPFVAAYVERHPEFKQLVV